MIIRLVKLITQTIGKGAASERSVVKISRVKMHLGYMNHVTRKTCLWNFVIKTCSSQLVQPLKQASLDNVDVPYITFVHTAKPQDADQTALMRRLISAFVIRIQQKRVFS